MHSEYTATETAATGVANPADPGAAVRKQAMRTGDHRQSAPLVVVLVLAIVFGLLPALYGWAVRTMLRRNLHRLREGDFEPGRSSRLG